MGHGELGAGAGLALLWLAAAAAAIAQPAAPGGPLPGPLPLFPADNWWNVDVSRTPVDPASASLIGFIGAGQPLHPDFGGDTDPPPSLYGFPYVVVPGSQPLVPVAFVEFGDESDAGAPGRPPGYPIPPEAATQPRWIEGGYPGNAQPGGDRHMLLVDRDNRILFELYHAQWNDAMQRWEAGSGAVFPLDSNRRRPAGWTSADAAGLAILPGLIRYDEVFGPDPIRHAFRFTVRDSNGYVFPASHAAGSNPAAPPMGTRLRLKAGKDLSSFPPEVQKIFQAMKTFGLLLADNGSDMYVQGTYDTRWNNDVLNPAFASLAAGDFEVVQLGWQPPAGPPPGPCIAGPTRLCLAAGRFAVDVQWTTAGGGNGAGQARPLTGDTGTFWFFDSANLELVVKLLDGCTVNRHFWFFAGGLTDLRTVITVTDSSTGAARRYINHQGTPFAPLQDTAAFAGCP
ncbi:MAG TPA: hypothetical protein VHR45_00185 [Thermoanaerobaculia bacterium]|nr:hypothetical protein [Thermoanaerobaculia bacterium]